MPSAQDSGIDLNPGGRAESDSKPTKQADESPRIIHEPATIKRLNKNMTVVNFSTNDLIQKESYSGNRLILISNFSFLLKISVMQLVIIGLTASPMPALIIMLVLELVYLGFNVIYFCKHRHLKSIILLIPRIAQPLALITAESLLLYNLLQFKSKAWALSESLQKFLIRLIFISNILEYIFLVLNIILIIKTSISDKKLMQSNPDYKRIMESKNDVIIYREPRFVDK